MQFTQNIVHNIIDKNHRYLEFFFVVISEFIRYSIQPTESMKKPILHMYKNLRIRAQLGENRQKSEANFVIFPCWSYCYGDFLKIQYLRTVMFINACPYPANCKLLLLRRDEKRVALVSAKEQVNQMRAPHIYLINIAVLMIQHHGNGRELSYINKKSVNQ